MGIASDEIAFAVALKAYVSLNELVCKVPLCPALSVVKYVLLSLQMVNRTSLLVLIRTASLNTGRRIAATDSFNLAKKQGKLFHTELCAAEARLLPLNK